MVPLQKWYIGTSENSIKVRNLEHVSRTRSNIQEASIAICRNRGIKDLRFFKLQNYVTPHYNNTDITRKWLQMEAAWIFRLDMVAPQIKYLNFHVTSGHLLMLVSNVPNMRYFKS